MNFKDLPSDVIERIGNKLSPKEQARLGIALGRDGMRLGEQANKRRQDNAATTLQSISKRWGLYKSALERDPHPSDTTRDVYWNSPQLQTNLTTERRNFLQNKYPHLY